MHCNEHERLTIVVKLFDKLFNKSYRTCLIGGAQEPLYEPAACIDQLHKLFFREDYLSSALHEVAHWCIAGPQRLLKQDFGYWYRPDGRSTNEQRQFEKVEAKPQALEWMFSIACGHQFSISLDNLSGSSSRSDANPDGYCAVHSFKQAISKQCIDWCVSENLPSRADKFIKGLMETFTTVNPYDAKLYQVASTC